MRRFLEKKWVRAAATAVVCAVLLTAVSLLCGGRSDPVTGAVGLAATPLRSLVDAFAQRAEVIFQGEKLVEELRAENAELRGQLTEAENNAQEVRRLERENESLYRLLNMRSEHSDMELQQTVFTAWTSTNYDSTFTIASGAGDGIEQGDCVITEEGHLVGVITRVSAGSATVTTILDPSSSISVNIGEAEGIAICGGDMDLMRQNVMRLSYIPDPAAVRTGDMVVTRKGSDLYPEGLVLGHISQVNPEDTGLSFYAIVQPAANFETLETLYVVTDFTKPEE